MRDWQLPNSASSTYARSYAAASYACSSYD